MSKMTSPYLQMCSILLALIPVAARTWPSAAINTHSNNKYFEPGATVVLKCNTKGEPIEVMTWSYKMNTDAAYEILTEGIHVNQKYNNSLELAGNKQLCEYNLRISNTTRSKQGIYTCVHTTMNILQVEVNLKIEEPPGGIIIVNISDSGIIIGREGQVFNVTCQVFGGHSKGQIYWRNSTDFTSRSPGDISWPMSHLNFEARYEHDGMNLTCVASHPMLKEEIQTSVTFRILYKPKIEIDRYPTGDIKEGQQMNLTCLDISNPPKTNMTWKKDGVILSSSPVYEKANLKTNDSGNYSCIVSNSLGTELDNIFIFVNKSYDEYNIDNLDLKSFLYFGILTLSCVLLVTSVICNICIHIHCKKLSRVPLQTGNNEVSGVNIEMTDINNGYHTINEEDIRQDENEVDSQIEIHSTNSSSSKDSGDKSDESATNENELRDSNDYLNPYCAVVESIADVHNYESLSVDKFELNMKDVDLNTGIQKSYENLKF